jgi:predicted transcriptional regulator
MTATRRLTAILAADVAGYSRLMGADEEGTHERLKAHLAHLIDLQQDYVVYLECGFRAQMLRRHLRVAHGLAVADYRTRWKLPIDYPVTAPNYSTQRSTVAKAMGFGRRRAAVAPSPPATEQPMTRRRRGRPRRMPTAT